MSAKEKSKSHSSCKACASRSKKKQLRKKFELKLFLFKLDWLEKHVASSRVMAKEDKRKLAEQILPRPGDYGAYRVLDDIPVKNLERRFKNLYVLMDRETAYHSDHYFHQYISQRADTRPSFHGDG